MHEPFRPGDSSKRNVDIFLGLHFEDPKMFGCQNVGKLVQETGNWQRCTFEAISDGNDFYSLLSLHKKLSGEQAVQGDVIARTAREIMYILLREHLFSVEPNYVETTWSVEGAGAEGVFADKITDEFNNFLRIAKQALQN